MHFSFKRIFTLLMAVTLVLSMCVCVFAADTEEKPVLRVGMDLGSAPYNWEGELGDFPASAKSKVLPISQSELYAYGYDVIIAKRIADKLGYDLEIVKVDRANFASALESGEVDVVSYVKENDIDLEKVALSSPYYYENAVVLMSNQSKYKFKADGKTPVSSIADFAGLKVGAIKDTPYLEAAKKIEGAEIVVLEAPYEISDAIDSGKVDVVVLDRLTATAAIETKGEHKVTRMIDGKSKEVVEKCYYMVDFYGTDGDFDVDSTYVNVCMAVKRDNETLWNDINSVIDRLPATGYEGFFANFDKTMSTVAVFQPGFVRPTPVIIEETFWDQIEKLIDIYGGEYLRGTGVTLLLSLVGTFFGCVIGFAVGIVQTIPSDKKRDSVIKRGFLAVVRAIMRAYVEVFRGTPMVVQAVFIYFGAQMLFGIEMNMWTAGYFIVSINTGAYMAETVRGGIISIDPGQTEGAKAIGMNHFQTMIHVILPQTFRVIIPQIGNNFIINIKDTSVLSIIAISDLFAAHKSAVSALYTYFASATIVMAIYLTLTMVASVLLRALEKKLGGDANYDLTTTDTLALTSGTYNFPDKRKKGENKVK